MTAPRSIRAKVAGWQAAERAARTQRITSLDAADLLAAAEEIRALNPAAFEGADSVRERELDEARSAWKRIRERWPNGAASSRGA